MIKGINKQILEVTNPESKYFEKIIFFVTPEGQNAKAEDLTAEANKIALTAKRPPRQRATKKQKLEQTFLAIVGLGAGAVLTLLLTNLIK